MLSILFVVAWHYEVRDAHALHALFSDTFGDGATILADTQATTHSIESALEELKKCSPDDVVVLSFSGHGSQNHQLVTYDTDVANLPGTTIPLEKLSEHFAGIPARRLVCFLDCCFSGGMGAKVLRTEASPRDMASAEIALQRLSGDGRLIFTASTAAQPAWENQRFGHGLLTWYLLEALCGAPEYRKGSSQDYIIPLVRKLVAEGKQVIVFRETKGEARGCANYLAQNLGLPPAEAVLGLLPGGDPSSASNALRECLAGGVAFHNADLDRDERFLIEQEFRKANSPVKVISATTTLAMGINTPAEAVIIAGLEHPGEVPTPYSVAEYKNMVGRAGRLGFATLGQSFLITTSHAEEHQFWENYIRGNPEDLKSYFLEGGTDVRSLLLRILASVQKSATNGLKREDLIAFLHGSFGAFLEREQNANWEWNVDYTESMLQELIGHGLIQQDTDNRLRLTPLGRLSGESGVEVESIIRLVDVLQHLPAGSISDPTLIATAQVTLELDKMLFPMNKKSTQKEPQQWSSELARQPIASNVIGAFDNWSTEQHQPTLRAKKAVACLYWISDTPMNDIERAMTQFGGGFDGAVGPVRAVAVRSADLLDTVVRVAELTHKGLDLSERRVNLITRLQVGVSNRNLGLAKLLGNNITRGDYLSFLRNELYSVEAITAASDEQMEAALGGTSEAKRKVQMIRNILAEKTSKDAATTPIVPLPIYE